MLFTFASVCLSATLDAQVLQLEQHVKSGRREFDERLMDEKGGGEKRFFSCHGCHSLADTIRYFSFRMFQLL